jgi:LysM repeat protein
VPYTTVSGDTLSGIATQFQSSADAIARANRLDDPDQLPIGLELTIPVFTPAEAAP